MGPEEGWVVCRVFKKKNYHKALESPSTSTSIMPRNDGVLDQLLVYMGRSATCKQESDPAAGFLHLPELQSPSMNLNDDCGFKAPSNELMGAEPSDWATLDRLVASQLNGQPPKHYADDFSFSFDQDDQFLNINNSDRGNDTDLWSFARSSSLSSSSSDPLCHLSV